LTRASTRVLLVEDSYGDVVLARRALELGEGARFELTVAGTLGDGIERLSQGFDAILLDITLPDSVGPETVTRMRAAARDLPIVVLSGAEDATVAGALPARGRRRVRAEGPVRAERAAPHRGAGDRARALRSEGYRRGVLQRVHAARALLCLDALDPLGIGLVGRDDRDLVLLDPGRAALLHAQARGSAVQLDLRAVRRVHPRVRYRARVRGVEHLARRVRRPGGRSR
jgi:CheY-like chemotaxis protein